MTSTTMVKLSITKWRLLNLLPKNLGVPILDYLLVRHFAVKWYGKFNVKRISDFVDEEFPIAKQDRLEEKPSSSKTSVETMFVGKSVKDLVEIAQMAAQMCAKAISG